jgi:hypothetical protein
MFPIRLATVKTAAIRRLLGLPLVAVALSLGGCFGAGMAAHNAFGDKNKDGASICRGAGTGDHGGSPGELIAWSDRKTGVQGTIQRVSRTETADGCRQYNQTLNIGTEAAHGSVKACPRSDGTWHLQSERTDVVSR